MNAFGPRLQDDQSRMSHLFEANQRKQETAPIEEAGNQWNSRSIFYDSEKCVCGELFEMGGWWGKRINHREEGEIQHSANILKTDMDSIRPCHRANPESI